MFTEALYVIAKLRKQPKCPLIDEQLNVCYTYKMKYSAIKIAASGS